jgi:hypothetical protein
LQETFMTRQIAFCLMALGLARCATTPLAPEADPPQPAVLQDGDQAAAPVAQAIRLHLQRARVEIAAARQLELEGDGRSEEMWARALADTNLALGMTREAAVHSAAGGASQALDLAGGSNGAGAP